MYVVKYDFLIPEQTCAEQKFHSLHSLNYSLYIVTQL